MPEPDSTILQSIATKHLIAFDYHGYTRTCEPHVFGVANGLRQVLCYQLEGGSERGGIPEWRRFDLGEISNVSMLEDTFPGVRFVPHPHSLGWDRLIEVVS